MPQARCTCGFTEAAGADETIADHLYEVFAPDDGTGPDGLVHLEGETPMLCMCGVGGTADKLDAHFASVFIPGDRTSRDGVIHEEIR